MRARAGGAHIVALDAARDAIVRIVETAGSLHAHGATAPNAKALTGRGVSWAFDIGDERWVVRHYRRGGLMARLLRDRYLRAGATRPWRELHASVEARRRGIRTPEVIGYVVHGAAPFYRADLATRWVPHSEDLASVTFGPDARSIARHTEAWTAAGALLRAVFDAGLIHPDLNLRNILIAGGGPVEAWLVDLDRCRMTGTSSDAARHAMLERFHRSRRKLELRFRRPVDAASLSAFAESLGV